MCVNRLGVLLSKSIIFAIITRSKLFSSMQTNSHARFCRPPICPKPEKANTITIDSNHYSPFEHLKKNQRLPHHHLPHQSNSPAASDSIQPSSSSSSLNCFQNKHEKANVLRNEYQQYSRKNYLKVNKNGGNEGVTESWMNQKVMGDCSEKNEASRSVKSKSALNYAKYFIKTVSNLPTEPSSQEQNVATLTSQTNEAILKLPAELQNQNRCPHERGRKTHRAKISERLKSLKSNRTKSNKKQLNERHLVASIEKRMRKEESRDKINANINNLHFCQSLVAKMKARSRNRRIVLKIKQLNLTKTEDSFSLMISSMIDKTYSAQIEIGEKIELHLQLLNLLPVYVKQFKQIYEEVECWDQLLFLTYKKFYLERLKIHLALSTHSINYIPFRFPFAAVSANELKQYRNSLAGIKLEQQVGRQNQQIKRALQQLYNHIIEKSGKYINLLEDDDFSEEIYWLMGQEVRLLEEGQRDHLREVRKKRIGLIIKCCFMMAFLNGEKLDIELLLTGEQYNVAAVKQFENFLKRLDQ